MDIIKISAFVFVGMMLTSCIPAFDRHIHTIITVAVCSLVALYVTSYLSPIIIQIKELAFSETYNFDVVFKVLGVGIISRFVSDLAADSGNKALSDIMIFAGKAACLVISLPVFLEVLQIVKELARGL